MSLTPSEPFARPTPVADDASGEQAEQGEVFGEIEAPVRDEVGTATQRLCDGCVLGHPTRIAQNVAQSATTSVVSILGSGGLPVANLLLAAEPVPRNSTPRQHCCISASLSSTSHALTLQWRSWYWPLEVPPPRGRYASTGHRTDGERPTVHPARWPLQASSSASSWALCRGEKRCPQLPRTQVHPAGLGKMFSGCGIFACAPVSSVSVPALHLRTLSAGPFSLKQNGVFTLVIAPGRTDPPTLAVRWRNAFCHSTPRE